MMVVPATCPVFYRRQLVDLHSVPEGFESSFFSLQRYVAHFRLHMCRGFRFSLVVSKVKLVDHLVALVCNSPQSQIARNAVISVLLQLPNMRSWSDFLRTRSENPRRHHDLRAFQKWPTPFSLWCPAGVMKRTRGGRR